MHPPGQSSLPPKPEGYPPSFQQNAYSSHYAQAYMQSQACAQPGPSQHNQQHQQRPYTNQARPRQPQPTGSWFQAGDKRCTYKDCRFTGSAKAVEVHMMDRHLIYPPGWHNRPKKEEWDADPSLKGKPIPIQGTNVILDSPETLEAWMAERRKRFPTANRVEDKKRKMEEAVARGQLTVEDMGVRPEKKRRVEDDRKNFRGNARRGRGGATHQPTRPAAPLPPKPTPQPTKAPPQQDDTSSSSDSDSEPEVMTSKPKNPIEPPAPEPKGMEAPVPAPVVPTPPPSKPRPLQPRRPAHNPFDNRPPLLRNLLLPEIRVTVSNLSQAIRFLVDNDFLKDVELKPGQAEDASIRVLSSSATGS